MTGFNASHAECVEALRTAAAVLEVRQPTPQAYCTVFLAPNRVMAHAAWVWPGVVKVTVRHSGELIAQSKPGRPFEIDPFAQ